MPLVVERPIRGLGTTFRCHEMGKNERSSAGVTTHIKWDIQHVLLVPNAHLFVANRQLLQELCLVSVSWRKIINNPFVSSSWRGVFGRFTERICTSLDRYRPGVWARVPMNEYECSRLVFFRAGSGVPPAFLVPPIIQVRAVFHWHDGLQSTNVQINVNSIIMN